MSAIWFLDCLVRDLSPGSAPDASYAMVEMSAPAGSQPPPHIHHNEDEGFYVLEGEITLFSPEGQTTLRPGEHLTTPRGVPHTFRAGPEGVRALVVSAPGASPASCASWASRPRGTSCHPRRPAGPRGADRGRRPQRDRVRRPPGSPSGPGPRRRRLLTQARPSPSSPAPPRTRAESQ